MQTAHFFDFSSMSASTISKPKVTSKHAWSIKYVKKVICSISKCSKTASLLNHLKRPDKAWIGTS